MPLREATIHDIKEIQIVRNSVRENELSDPSLVTDADCEEYILNRGKGWVYEVDNRVVGFAIADLVDHNIWALFLHPDYERQGIGKVLHDTMLDWYFSQTQSNVWLSTDPQTRAYKFYLKAGWTEVGEYGKGEVKFEMTHAYWLENE